MIRSLYKMSFGRLIDASHSRLISMKKASLVTNQPNIVTVEIVAFQDPHLGFITRVQSWRVRDFTATIPALRIRSWVLGAAKNPVSLPSKHGLAYHLDESGIGCLQNCVQVEARGGGGGQKKSEGGGGAAGSAGKFEVNS